MDDGETVVTYDLSILIPARNEIFLSQTIDNILERRRGKTEVIAICDGNWPDPGVKDHPDVTLVYYPKAIGQRAATNQAAKLSDSKFIMKADAHCAFDKGFDVKLMEDCEYDWTVIPKMYNLHGFNWVCNSCKNETYQGAEPKVCNMCKKSEGFTMSIKWKPRRNRLTEAWRFDENMKFQYWRAYSKRPEFKGRIQDVMSSIGACWMMHRERYWELEGLDEKHGSWGQMGTEIACKSWLSGGRHVVNRRTWFAHMFRTQKGFKFPYPLSSKQVNHARRYSNDIWKNNKWPKQTCKLQWLIDKFKPPGWENTFSSDEKVEKLPFGLTEAVGLIPNPNRELTRGIVYYTDNSCSERILQVCRGRISKICKGWGIVSVSQYPINFGKNFVLPLNRSVLSLYQQVVKGLQESDDDIIFLCEHDVLYSPEHFDVIPPDENTFYYDHNRWCVEEKNGKAVTYLSDCPSFMCAHKDLLLRHYTKCMEFIDKNGWHSKYGYSPPKGLPKEQRIGKVEHYMSPVPSIDIRCKTSWTSHKMKQKDFRTPPKEWKESDRVPGWGITKDRFEDFLREQVL